MANSRKWGKIRKRVMERDYIPNFMTNEMEFVCKECGAILRRNQVSVDHIHPKAAGGTDDLSNLRITCIPCNARKSGESDAAKVRKYKDKKYKKRKRGG